MSSSIFENLTDNESCSSWDETDDETEYDDPVYDPEEPSLTKYNIVLCELYNNETHGFVDGDVNNHYLTLIRFTELDNSFVNLIRRHSNNNEAKLEIAQCIYLPSEHCVSIIKTYWLRLIQRTWRKICRNRKLIIKQRCNPNSLKYREIYGKWPSSCSNYPSLNGMLNYLSRTSST